MMMFKKFRQTHNFNLYILLWIVALAIVFYLSQHWFINKKFIGIVERKSHPIGARESGKVQNMLITIGDQVKKDQVLAILDISDLKTTLDQLKQELTSFRVVKSYLPRVVAVHMNPYLEKEIAAEIANVAEELNTSITLAYEGMRLHL